MFSKRTQYLKKRRVSQDIISDKSPNKKPSLFQRLFSLKSEDDDDFQLYRQMASRRRHTVQMDRALYFDGLTLAEESDEAMMAKASADCLIDRPDEPQAPRARPSSTSPRKERPQRPSRKPQSVSPPHKETKSSPGLQSTGADDTAARKSNNQQTTKLTNGIKPNTNGEKNSNNVKQCDKCDKCGNNRTTETTLQVLAQSSINKPTDRGPNQKNGPNPKNSRKGEPKGGSTKRRSLRQCTSSASLTSAISLDTSKPLVFPSTPETILEYHKRQKILDQNEEWLVVELNEYECLVDSLDILKIIAKHSKFFEVEPDDLWQEFFDFVDELPAYDEMITFDVWQEFRDKKYVC